MPRIPLIIVPEGFEPENNRAQIGLSFQKPIIWKQPFS
jgi:hypothetical protein